MSAKYGRCQVCGRKKAKKSGGLIVKHYFKGGACLGSSALPFDEASDALKRAFEAAEQTDDRCEAKYRAHRESQVNEPLPVEFWRLWLEASRERRRLERRLKRWRRLQEEAAKAGDSDNSFDGEQS